jgi:ABC-type enterochelin transport system substrate-binding protein
MGIGDNRPTDQAIAFYQEVSSEIDQQISALGDIFGTRIDAFNKAVIDNRIEAVKLED